MEREEIRAEIRKFIEENVHLDDIANFTDDQDIFEEGGGDSWGFFILIEFLEQNYGISFSSGDYDPSEFVTISNLTDFILKKKSE